MGKLRAEARRRFRSALSDLSAHPLIVMLAKTGIQGPDLINRIPCNTAVRFIPAPPFA
jgi:hypothetical protein